LTRKAWSILLALGFLLGGVCYIFTLAPGPVAAKESISWQTYDGGIDLAKNEGKKVFLHFYANWCFYCRKMAKETFEDPSVIAYLNKNFISVRINTDQDKRTASMYSVRALPSTWFLTKKGEPIGNVPGYMSSKQFLELLQRIVTGQIGDKGKET
jgi:thioredoxin-related protein